MPPRALLPAHGPHAAPVPASSPPPPPPPPSATWKGWRGRARFTARKASPGCPNLTTAAGTLASTCAAATAWAADRLFLIAA